MNKKSIVVVGGGTGTHTVLRGLRAYTDTVDLAAVVSMADSGGSTGRLRDEFGQLPAGDVRNALTALAADEDDEDKILRQLFLYRFDRGAGLSGHNFGNLFLTALTDILGSEVAAIKAAGRILRVTGRVIPVTTNNVHLVATYADGTTVVGEHAIEESTTLSRITNLALTKPATLYSEAATALTAADLIVIGPGDLYTSILANCIIEGFAAALRTSPATVVYVCNLMSRPGQTTGFNCLDHCAEVTHYIGRVPDYLLINTTPLPADLLARYAEEGTYPVVDTGQGPSGMTIIRTDLLATAITQTQNGDVLKRSLIRHDSDKLAAALYALL